MKCGANGGTLRTCRRPQQAVLCFNQTLQNRADSFHLMSIGGRTKKASISRLESIYLLSNRSGLIDGV